MKILLPDRSLSARLTRLACLSTALLVGVLLAAAPASAYDWRQIMREALNNDESVATHRQKFQHAKNLKSLAIAYEAIPDIKLSGEGGELAGQVLSSGSSLRIAPYGQVSLDLNQKLIDGGERKAKIRKTRTDISVAQFALQRAERDLITRALSVHIDLRYRALLHEAHSYEEALLRQNLLQPLGGFSEQWRAERALQQKQVAVLQSRHDLDVIRGRFITLFGFVPDVDQLTHIDLPLSLIPRTFEQSLRVAERVNPAYVEENYKVQAVGYDVLKAQSQALPQVSLTAGGRYRYNSLPESQYHPNQHDVAGYLGLRIDWDASGSIRYSKLSKAARSKIRVAEGVRGEFVRKSHESLASSWNRLVLLSAQYRSMQAAEAQNAAMLARNANEAFLSVAESSDLYAQYFASRVQFLDIERQLTLVYVTLLGEIGLLSPAALNI